MHGAPYKNDLHHHHHRHLMDSFVFVVVGLFVFFFFLFTSAYVWVWKFASQNFLCLECLSKIHNFFRFGMYRYRPSHCTRRTILWTTTLMRPFTRIMFFLNQMISKWKENLLESVTWITVWSARRFKNFEFLFNYIPGSKCY